MCSNYRPVTSADRLLTFFGVERDMHEPPADVFPSGLAPMILLGPDDGTTPRRMIALESIFRFVPEFIAKLAWARQTFNARGEEVSGKRTYKDAWAKGHRCIIPAEAIYEPNYESGKHERWAIQQPGPIPMGIAGIYKTWQHPDGRTMYGMAMLTVNADDHPFMKRFHKPEDEKRMVVILAEQDYLGWLTCTPEEAKGYLKQWHGPLEGSHAPLPARAPRGVLGVIHPRQTPLQDDFFAPPTAGEFEN